jgi:selenide,water dikinase
MKRLNKDASGLALAAGVRSGTDVTGFSLLGHGMEIANASKVALRIGFSQVPFVAGARGYAAEWIFPGGSYDNQHYFESQVRFSPEIEEIDRMLLFDAQTSGGLLLCVPPARLDSLLDNAGRFTQPLWQIGEVVTGEGIEVVS